jgi:hypothetical protein
MKTKTSFVASILNHPARLLSATLTLAFLLPAGARSQPLEKVDLGSAAKFAVLAGSLVSNIPTSAVTGDIGLSPSAGSKITGFGPAEVTGNVYTVDATGPAGSVPAASDLTAAKGDLTIAYNDAAGRTPVPEGPFLNPGAGDIGGMTLIPGLYKFTSTLAITGSDVTLDGGANDVWIFQIASDLNVANDIKVILAGGAQAANIFWQIGTSATLGTHAVVQGTLLADQSISLNTGATLDGRALASIAAITLASGSTVTRPALPAGSALVPAPQRGYTLGQGPANGWEGASTIEFSVPGDGNTSLTVMDVRGREIATLFKGRASAGKIYRVSLGSVGPNPGLLIARLEVDGQARLTKTLLAH